MNCHQHSTKDAIAVCRACGRAVCRECMQFSDYREAVCSDVCGQERERVHAMRAAFTVEIDSKVRAYAAISALFWMVGGVFLLFACVLGYETFASALRRQISLEGLCITTLAIIVAGVCGVAARVTRRCAIDYQSIADRLEQ